MWRLLQRVHPIRQPEEAHADPRQREALPVPRLLQDLRPEADPENAHDRAPAGQTFQMQGESGKSRRVRHDPATLTGADVMPLPLRYAASPSTECTTSLDTCTSMPAASHSSALTAPASSTWRETSADTWRSNTALWTLQWTDKVNIASSCSTLQCIRVSGDIFSRGAARCCLIVARSVSNALWLSMYSNLAAKCFAMSQSLSPHVFSKYSSVWIRHACLYQCRLILRQEGGQFAARPL